MKLFKLTQEVNLGYDKYLGFVVCAENEEKARLVKELDTPKYKGEWVSNEDDIIVEYLGESKDGMGECILLENYNAG